MATENRHYSMFDRLLMKADDTLRALTNNVKTTGKIYPAKKIAEQTLSDKERLHAAALMRINHTGEICAQALYHGQALVSRADGIQVHLQQAAMEEGDHLAWCKMRLDELGSRTSYLNPLWYAGSFCIGVMAGVLGDKWSLGFVAETEYQVIKHLQEHLAWLPAHDQRSHGILQQMKADETKHRQDAIASGAKELPAPVKYGMTLTSKVMVKTAYWV